MIVRILGEGQYDLEGEALARLKQLDEVLFHSVAQGDEDAYRRDFGNVLALVRAQGQSLPIDRLVESDLILPAADTSLADARKLFTEQA